MHGNEGKVREEEKDKKRRKKEKKGREGGVGWLDNDPNRGVRWKEEGERIRT